MNITNLKQKIEQILRQDERLWQAEEFNQTLLIDLVEKTDETVINLLLKEEETREKFFIKIKDAYVFKTNDFRFFMEENKIDNSYTVYKNRIGLTDGKKFLKDTDDVVLDFPYKDCVLEGGQSTEEGTDVYFEYSQKTENYEQKNAKRNEIFFNQTLAQDEIDRLFDAKALTNWKKIYRGTNCGKIKSKIPTEIKRDEDGTIKENLIIKGNNLLALHSLKHHFTGKVKLIYIDPPYNTGNDGFKYNDSFNHSTWLTFMKNRLEVARTLLRDDGVIFVQCDDNEQAYLKVLMDEVFGRGEFVSNIVWEKKFSPQNDAKWLSDNHDFIMVYGKIKDNWHINLLPRTDEMNARYKNLDNDPRGDWTSGALQVKTYSKIYDYPITTPSGREVWAGNGSCWRFSKEKLQELIKDNRIWFGADGSSVPRFKRFLSEVQDGLVPLTLWRHSEVGHNQQAKQDTGKMGFNFSSPKPEALLERVIQIATNPNDIVLDYHLGSGTTCAVAHKMGRQYIGIEQMDYIETIAVERLKKVIDGEQGGVSTNHNWQGGGDFIYCELTKWNEKAKEQINTCESVEELEAFFDTMYERYFLNYNLKLKEFREGVVKEREFRSLKLEEQKKMFLTMLDLNQMYVNKTEMADSKYGIDEESQKLTELFYNK